MTEHFQAGYRKLTPTRQEERYGRYTRDLGAFALAWTGRDNKQSLGQQGQAGARVDRSTKVLASVPAALRSGARPHRGSLLEGQRYAATNRGADPRSAGSDNRHSPRCSFGPRRPRLLRTLRLPSARSTSITSAVPVTDFDKGLN